MVDGGEPGVDSRDEGKHTGRNDLLFVWKMMTYAYACERDGHVTRLMMLMHCVVVSI